MRITLSINSLNDKKRYITDVLYILSVKQIDDKW